MVIRGARARVMWAAMLAVVLGMLFASLGTAEAVDVTTPISTERIIGSDDGTNTIWCGTWDPIWNYNGSSITGPYWDGDWYWVHWHHWLDPVEAEVWAACEIIRGA